ncbi:MAG: hypothetical protein HPZ91_12840 [Lentisphaeria bacterium]|nr:hypothetical protein [Lentisphaeria bacterium]
MSRIFKAVLLAAVLAAGATCVQARDRGPGDGVEITRAIVRGVTQILSPRPCPPPPPRVWCPPPPPEPCRPHHPRFAHRRPERAVVIERTIIVERPYRDR